MSGTIRPSSPIGNLQETGAKKARILEKAENISESGGQPVAVPHASNSQEAVPATPPPFPKLLSVQAGIAPEKVSASSISLEFGTLLKSLERDDLQVNASKAAEISAKFHATKEVDVMHKMQKILPHFCSPCIHRYLALEQKGAAHLTTLSSKVSTHGIGLDEMPLFRFLPLCIHLQKLEVEMEIIDEYLYLEVVPSLSKILASLKDLEEFKLILCTKRPNQSLDYEDGNFTDILVKILEVLLRLPKMKKIQVASLIPGYNLIAGIDEILHENLLNQLAAEQKSQCQVMINEDPGRIELRKFLSRAELERCLRILTELISSGAQKGCIQALTELVPELPVSSDLNEQIKLEELSIYFLEKGHMECGFWQDRRNKIEFHEAGFPSSEVSDGYLDIIYKS
jgi:hypothetical protein